MRVSWGSVVTNGGSGRFSYSQVESGVSNTEDTLTKEDYHFG